MRAFLLLLTLLLPLQFSWAAVAVYCQAPQAAAPAHLGHHEHRAVQTGDGAGAGELPTQGGDADAACSLCHFTCIKSLQVRAPGMPQARATSRLAAAGHCPAPASHIADGPDKPNWLLAA